MAKGTSRMRASVCANRVLPEPVGPIKRMFDLSISTSEPPVAVHQPLVMAVDRHREHLLGVLLANDVLVQLGDDLPRRGDFAEQRLAGSATASFLFEDRLAEVDTLAADVNVAGPLDQRTDVAIALSTEGAKRILLGGAGSAASPRKITS